MQELSVCAQIHDTVVHPGSSPLVSNNQDYIPIVAAEIGLSHSHHRPVLLMSGHAAGGSLGAQILTLPVIVMAM